MADQALDRLIFELAGDVTSLKAAYAQAEAGAAKTGSTIQANLGAGFKDAASAATSHAGQIKASLGGVADGAKKVGEHIQVSRRELVYFFRELANGDLQRMPATFALLASHILELSPVAILAGASIAAIPIAVAVAVGKADSALAALRTNLALTGHYAGMSVGEMAAMSSQVAGAAQTSVPGAQRLMGGLLGAGATGANLRMATIEAGQFALGTGGTEKDAIGAFGRVFSDPAKAAEEMNRQYHFLTAAQEQQVKDLSEQGKEEQAAAIILQNFAQNTKEAAEGASLFSKMMNFYGNQLGNIGHNIALNFGGGTPEDRLAMLNARDRAYFESQGAAGMRRYQGGAHMPGYAALAKPLQDEIAANAAAEQAKAQAKRDQETLHKGYELANQGANKFANSLSELHNKTELAGAAALVASKHHDENAKAISAEWSASVTAMQATKKYGSPEAEAAQRLKDARERASASPEALGYITARQQADEKYRQNLMSGQFTQAQADAIHKTDLAAARYDASDANRARAQAQKLKDMQMEVAVQANVADAYEKGSAAVEQAKIAGEVDVAITNRQIAAKDRLAAIAAKTAAAYEQLRGELGKQAESFGIDITAKAMETEGGGSPLERARAKARAEAYRATEEEYRRAAGNPLLQADILAGRGAREAATNYQDQAQGRAGLRGQLYDDQSKLAMERMMNQAVGSGASEDDLRHLKVWQAAVEDFNKRGLDPAIAANRDLFQQVVQTNIAISDMSDSLQKAQQEAKGLADSITGGLSSWLNNPTMKPMDALGGIGKNMLNQIVQTNILEPMNKWLTSQFAGMIGPGQLGTSSNPMYVQFAGGAPGGGVPGTGNSGALDAEGNPLSSYNGPNSGSGMYGPGGLAGPGSMTGGGGLNSLFGSMSNGTGMFGQGGIFGSSGFFSNLFNGGGGAGSASSSILSLFGSGGAATVDPFAANLAVQSDALANVGNLSSLAALPDLAPLADGGPMNPGQPYLVGEEGPEIMQVGSGGYVTPLSAPVVRQALGSPARTGGNTDNSVGPVHINLPGVTDAQSFIRSSSQVSAAVTKAASMGRRNT